MILLYCLQQGADQFSCRLMLVNKILNVRDQEQGVWCYIDIIALESVALDDLHLFIYLNMIKCSYRDNRVVIYRCKNGKAEPKDGLNYSLPKSCFGLHIFLTNPLFTHEKKSLTPTNIWPLSAVGEQTFSIHSWVKWLCSCPEYLLLSSHGNTTPRWTN